MMKDVDGRDKPGHDGLWTSTTTPNQKSRHHRACPGDPRPGFVTASKACSHRRRTWMAGTSSAKTRFALIPGHDEKYARDIGAKQSFVASPGHAPLKTRRGCRLWRWRCGSG